MFLSPKLDDGELLMVNAVFVISTGMEMWEVSLPDLKL